jgi:hypothetical protein
MPKRTRVWVYGALLAVALLAVLFVVWRGTPWGGATAPGAFRLVSADQLSSHLGEYVEMTGVFRSDMRRSSVETGFGTIELMGLDDLPHRDTRIVVAGRLALQHGLSEVELRRAQKAATGYIDTPMPHPAHFALQDTEVIAKAARWWPF